MSNKDCHWYWGSLNFHLTSLVEKVFASGLGYIALSKVSLHDCAKGLIVTVTFEVAQLESLKSNSEPPISLYILRDSRQLSLAVKMESQISGSFCNKVDITASGPISSRISC